MLIEDSKISHEAGFHAEISKTVVENKLDDFKSLILIKEGTWVLETISLERIVDMPRPTSHNGERDRGR